MNGETGRQPCRSYFSHSSWQLVEFMTPRPSGKPGAQDTTPERRILFLDIDGVMIPFGEKEISRDCAENLRHIMKATGAGIVISSTWRAPPIERLLKVWRAAGLRESWILGGTPDLALSPDSRADRLRGMEIQAWLTMNGAAGARFAIIDDQCDDITPCFPPHVVFTTKPELGLTRQVADNVIHCLMLGR